MSSRQRPITRLPHAHWSPWAICAVLTGLAALCGLAAVIGG